MHLAIERVDGYEFRVRIDGLEGRDFTVEEPAPIGEGRSPSPEALLAAAVGSCLSASLLFCMTKARVEARDLRADVDLETQRNERGRLRIGAIRAALRVGVGEEQRARFERCRELFEDFCVVTESVRAGIPVEVSVDRT